MLGQNEPRRAVKVLRESVARRIAAGEVIDRPASVVRELLDNAIDAGSTEISVYIEEGGVGRIRVVDNGCGMSEKDIELCCLPHATSKIDTEEDLYRVTSLGFRGEALASIAAVSRLEITSKDTAEGAARKIVIHGGKTLSCTPAQGNRGTLVDVADLFYAIPARRRFIKSPSAETSQCKAVFLEKAAAFPGIAFKFFTDNTMKVFLPAAGLADRVSAAWGELDRSLLGIAAGSSEGFRLELVAGAPELARKDRRYIQIYVNRRRIWDYALLQGVEYTYSSWLPGGLYPACFVFIDIQPDLVDFNIHPAKKEVKIKNISELRHRLSEVLGSHLRQLGLKSRAAAESQFPQPETGGEFPFAQELMPSAYGGARTDLPHSPRHYANSGFPSTGLQLGEAAPSFLPDKKYDFIYRGQVFGLFLVAEKGGSLYLVDQHAAHERLIYETLAADTRSQTLLIPHEFDSGGEDETIERNAGEAAVLGITVKRLKGHTWSLTALPESYRGAEEEIIKTLSSCPDAAGELKKEIFASLSCKKAIKDGSPIDPLSACEIIEAAFGFENPRCPHGRPLWFEISREELFRKVGRIV